MTGKKFKTAALATTAIATILAGTQANAQASGGVVPEASSEEAEVVIVTATRRDERLIDVPAAVTAISGGQLSVEGLSQIQDYVSKVPGFSLQTEGRLGTRLILRGQNTGGSGASVATMMDDVVLNTATANSLGYTVTANFETFDLERIEVLRGPQGTLYGATAQGGLLKYVTTKPKLDAFSGKVEVGGENVRDGETGYSVKGVVNVPIIEGKLALRAMGYYKDVPGFIDNPLLKREDINGGEQYGGRLAISFIPSDKLEMRLLVQTQKQTYGAEGYAEVNGSRGNGQETAASFDLVTGKPISRKRFDEVNESSYTLYNGVVDYDFGFAKLTSSTSYVEARSSYFNDITDLGLGFAGTVPIIQSNDHDKFNQEFRLASRDDGNVTWQVGLFYSDEEIFNPQKIDSRNPANFAQPGFLGALSNAVSTATYKELSGFGDVTIKMGDKAFLSVGGRYTANEQTYRYTFSPALFSGFQGGTLNATDSDETKFTFSVAPRYEFNEFVTGYARIASGYRPGGPIPRFSAGINYAKSTFDADTTLNYEFGIKGSTPDRRVSFDIALFRIDWDDVQIVTGYNDAVTNVTYTAIGNAGTAQSQGLEWTFGLRPMPGLVFSLAGAYTDATLTENAPSINGFKGDELPYVPKLSNALGADYRFPIAPDLEMSVGLSVTYVGERFGNFSTATAFGVSSHPEIPDYISLDLRAGLDFKRFRVDAGIRNASNEVGITSYTNNSGFQGAAGQANIIQPRTFSLRISTDF